jgi:tetratricopeptide (TPR) repeat protein
MRRSLCCVALVVWAVSVCAAGALGTTPPAPNVLDAVRASVDDGNLGAAIARLEPYVAANPKDADAARMLGDLYFRNAEPARAEAVWQALTRRMPEDLETHARLGTLYAARNRPSDAIKEFEQSMQLRRSLFALIDLERHTSDLRGFVARLQDDASQHPDDPWSVSAYATVLEQTGHPAEALGYYNRALHLAPTLDACEPRANRALDLLDLRRDGDAIADLRACLHGDPNNYPALVILGFIYLKTNAYDQARPVLEHALDVEPNGVEALIDMGFLDDAAGDTENATLFYRKALAVDPLRPEAYVNLGFDFAAIGQYAQAEAMYAAGLTAVPESARLHYLLGAAFRSEGKFDLAHAQFEAALTADDENIAKAARDAIATLHLRNTGLG